MQLQISDNLASGFLFSLPFAVTPPLVRITFQYLARYVWVCGVSGAAGDCGSACDRWGRCLGVDAYRRGQVAVLPNSGDCAAAGGAGGDGGGVATDCADARPSGRALRSGCERGVFEFFPQLRRKFCAGKAADEGRSDAALRRTRARDQPAFFGAVGFAV